jgi:hypothetical protein
VGHAPAVDVRELLVVVSAGRVIIEVELWPQSTAGGLRCQASLVWRQHVV